MSKSWCSGIAVEINTDDKKLISLIDFNDADLGEYIWLRLGQWYGLKCIFILKI